MNSTQDHSKSLTKAERKQLKLQQNREWLHNYRSNGIEQKDLNERYTGYYQLQLQPYWQQSSGTQQEEWERFIFSLKQPLNVSFRISERLPRSLQHRLYQWLTRRSHNHLKISIVDEDRNQFESREVILRPIAWCSPSAYEYNIDNHHLLNQTALSTINQFLALQSSLGWVVRQELVSMIPVCLLDVHYSHRILDCCAAPGSKTEQIVACMEASYQTTVASNPLAARRGRGSGCVIANDTDQKRIHELIHKFAAFPSANIAFTNMNGERFASYFSNHNQDGDTTTSVSKGDVELFDRILCDVPCSGDGTFRKSPHLWRLFRPRTGLQFHLIQRQILLQALQVLKPQGRLVYSTCSLNPIEDEAVVASVLKEYQNKIR